MDLLRLNRGRLRRVLNVLGLDVLGLYVLLLNMLLSRRALLGLLGEVLRVLLLLLLLLLRVLLNMLRMLYVLRHVLLLLRGMLRHDGRLDRARVVLLLLLLVLMLGLCLGLGLCLSLCLSLGLSSVWLGAICSVVWHGIIAAVHFGLAILMWLGAVTPRLLVSKRRLLLGHWHGLLGLGRP